MEKKKKPMKWFNAYVMQQKVCKKITLLDVPISTDLNENTIHLIYGFSHFKIH